MTLAMMNGVALQELRDIAMAEAVKGKHFFLESDIKGPSLKLDNTGRAILTVSFSCLYGAKWLFSCIDQCCEIGSMENQQFSVPDFRSEWL